MLQGKKILFVGQELYDYHEKIIKRLQDFGAEVTFIRNAIFKEDPEVSKTFVGRLKGLTRVGEKVKYINLVLGEIEGVKFDFLFCIGGFSVTPEFIGRIRAGNPSMVSILYFWDSFSVYNYSNLLSCFSRVYSFDRRDCNRFPSLRYLPLFYSEEFAVAENEESIDILYIGSAGIISRNRFRILAKIARISETIGLTFQICLVAPKLPYGDSVFGKIIDLIRGRFDRSYREYSALYKECLERHNFIRHIALPKQEVSDLVRQARCVVDIPVPGQVGLTIRSIETLASGKKLLTMNKGIIDESFFDTDRISIFEEDNIYLDKEFIKRPVQNSADGVKELELGSWLQKIFQEDE